MNLATWITDTGSFRWWMSPTIFFRKHRMTSSGVGLRGTVGNKRLMVIASCTECSEYKSYFSRFSLRIKHMFFLLTTVDRETAYAPQTLRLQQFSLFLFPTIIATAWENVFNTNRDRDRDGDKETARWWSREMQTRERIKERNTICF